ncbi:YolA family protein [Sphingomonas sp. RP10(2022)]|uniref:YolA family protein n=1 Tax=Sphingomonas liriopis TaxID=2949094 RepID=A0A9X2KQ02_9SPHN|nr:DUF4879 domain-containing protein [Sphingomonas liriopis]MCP3734457.1 YolA family protein [Sphingomonas liriopis]
MIRAVPLVALVAAPALAQSAPPLTDVQIAAITSATQAERIAPGQTETARRHTGPITLVVREKGIGRARLLRIDGRVTAPPSTTRPLCGAAVTAGACKPGEATTGLEITWHLGPLPAGTTVSVQDSSANLPAQTLTAEITIG